MKHKSAPEILADKIGVLKIDGVKWDRVSSATNKILSAMEAYRSQPSQVEGLPDRDAVSEYADKHSNYFEDKGVGKMCNAAQNQGVIDGAEWVKGIASAIIAKKDEEIENFKKTIISPHGKTMIFESTISKLRAEKEELEKALDDKDKFYQKEMLGFNDELLSLRKENEQLNQGK